MRQIPGAAVGSLLFWPEPDNVAEVVTLFLQADGTGHKSAPAAGPGTARRGRPVRAVSPP
jgi:hypothetical protein